MIIERPDLDLVGLRVYDPAKVGVEAGDFVDMASVGVTATDDSEAILTLDAGWPKSPSRSPSALWKSGLSPR
ncbi:hypothetical protein [Mycobacterium sp.]|uniref:hypothetical protein n=1 Tax=Mycobacterium sp. TaxID=1785 RepID=UPI002D861357|nr:hypothetical protein [Mycobacterium sp.]